MLASSKKDLQFSLSRSVLYDYFLFHERKHISLKEWRKEQKEKRDVLNFRAKVAGLAAMALGRSWMSMVMVERALEGSAARKFRAVLPDFGLNGEKAVTTEVMYLVIMMAVGLWRERGGRE